jgi:hypothetical protein
MKNNIVHENQAGQVKSLMIYDIPVTWSREKILEHLKTWGWVLNLNINTNRCM